MRHLPFSSDYVTLQDGPDDKVCQGRLVANEVGTQCQVLVEFLERRIQRFEIACGQFGISKIEPLINLCM